jgi:protein dithiol oxidoreductase (disulfide-forming)
MGNPHTMLRRTILAVLLALCASSLTRAADPWVEGRNYFPIDPSQRTNVAPGKVEVLEVFSYGCPACNAFQPVVQQLRRMLPANAQMNYLPASFQAAEDWPMFQRAFLTAQVLGVVDKTHDSIYDAVWKPGGPLATFEPNQQKLKNPLPSIEDAAKIYNKLAGVPVDKFVATAKSFTIEVKMKSADALILAYRVDRTPTIIVNGKYRITTESAGGTDQVIALVKYLVAKETK